MSILGDVWNNVSDSMSTTFKGATSTITDGWSDFKNLSTLSMPRFNLKELFKSMSQSAGYATGVGADRAQRAYANFIEMWTAKGVTAGDGKSNVMKEIADATRANASVDDVNNYNKWQREYNQTQIDAANARAYAENVNNGNQSSRFPGLTNFLADYYADVAAKKFDEMPMDPNTFNEAPGAKNPVTDWQQGYQTNSGHIDGTIDTNDADRLVFQTMDWGYADFINERSLWQKSLQNPLGEPGWFYFKIFFNFDTQYGLLGGLLNNDNPLKATNSAFKYLHTCTSLGTYSKCPDRMIALQKFASILSYISTYAPWFFKSVKNLNEANVPVVNDLTKERTIEIECNPDAIDMRLTTLLDLYKFACYDEMDLKEIVPDNLRKFDMTVMLFQAPIKYFHTAFKSNSGMKYNYKTATVDNRKGFADTMSFKMFTFINCEINRECLGTMIPNSVSNEKPFQMGGGTIKINYDRIYTHNMNEFMHLMIGNDGLYYDGSISGSKYNHYDDELLKMQAEQANYQRKRVSEISEAAQKDSIITQEKAYSGTPTDFKHIVDMSETLCTNNLRQLGINSLGNFSGSSDPQFNRNDNDVSTTEFFDLKLAMLKNDPSVPTKIESLTNAPNELTKNLVETYINTQSAIYARWTTNGYGITTNEYNTPILEYGNSNGTMYFKEKLSQLTDGVVSPETLVTRNGSEYYERYRSLIRAHGYGDKQVGTEYWDAKMRQLKDGVASPETDISVWENQWRDRGWVHNYLESGYINKMINSRYWTQKMKQLVDGIVSPETVSERYDNQNYENNYSEQGYLNKTTNTKYWQTKLKQFTDGIVSPDTVTERYESQLYEHNYSETGYDDKGAGTEYWNDKLDKIKNGNIKGMYDDKSDACSKYWNAKMQQVNDNIVAPETISERYINQQYEHNYTDGGYNDKDVDTEYWNDKQDKIKNGNIKGSYDDKNDAGSEYWNAKNQKMFDGIASPETISEAPYNLETVQGYAEQQYNNNDNTLASLNNKLSNIKNGTIKGPSQPSTLTAKLQQLTDGIVSPETISERYVNQRYEHNYSEGGYSDTDVKTGYWNDKIGKIKNGNIKGSYDDSNDANSSHWRNKINQLMDNIVSPETISERYVNQNYAHNFSDGGYSDTDVGSNYWNNKMNELKNGNIKGSYDDKSDAGSDTWRKKMEQMNDGKASPETQSS